MKRRTLLRAAALFPLASPRIPLPFDAADATEVVSPRRMRRVRPSDPSWPEATSWRRLKEAVDGDLTKVHSLFEPCAADRSGTACHDALKNIKNPYWIGDQAAGTEVSGWLDAWAPAPSAYVLNARNAVDVAAGVNFARAHNLRLVVKGGGHSYQGTSNAPDSLLIWTRSIDRVTLHDAFVGKGCEGRVEPIPAVSTGAGAVWMDLYHAVTTEAGRYVQGGGCATVGVAGLVQSGGFGWFSKAFGTAAAGLLEAEIVTADGRVRIVNACSDPELFWALKGGGGGTFGVVTKLTLRTHELPRFFGSVSGKIKAQSDDAFRRLIARFISFYQEKLFNPHWGDTVHCGPDNTLQISMASQGLDNQQVNEVWRPFFDWVSAWPRDFAMMSPLRAGAGDSRHLWDVREPQWIRDMRKGAPAYHAWNRGDQGECGAFLYGYDSLWLPAALLQADRQQELVEALFAASRHELVRLHINKGLAGAPADAIAAARQTATNPAVLDAFTLVILADGDETPAYPGFPRRPIDLAAAHKAARDIDLAAAALRQIAPHSGSYVSESNFFNRSWQSDYWGNNYARLLAVKKTYDPDGLFIVHHGVGSEYWSPDGFERLA